MLGLASLTSVALSFYVNKPLSLVPFDIDVLRLLADTLCGIGVAVFMWWLFLEMKSRLKRSQGKHRLE
jgi:uncharacterized membrane protein YgaE (UPF0421/DUF939 family)